MITFNPKKLKILQCTVSSLREPSKDVTEFDKTLSDLAKTMNKMMKDPLGDGVDTVGLSAVQVGINLKLCVCKNPSNDKSIIMVNPSIVNASSDMSKELEGCLSVGVGAKQLFAYVPRPKEITVRYFDLRGNEFILSAKNLFSHIVQHEIDHMKGVLFIDYIDDPNEIMTLAELNEQSKNKELHLEAI